MKVERGGADVILMPGARTIAPVAINPDICGFQPGMSAQTVNGRIFADEMRIPMGQVRMPGGTIANFAQMTGGNFAWNIDESFVIEGDPVQNHVKTQNAMKDDSVANYAYGPKQMKLSQRVCLVVNIMFTKNHTRGALRDFMALIKNGIDVFVVEFSNEWFMKRWRGRLVKGDPARERQILIARCDEVRISIEQYCHDNGLRVPRFCWPWAGHDEREDWFEDHNEAIIAAMRPGDLVAHHDYFIGHWELAGSRVDSARSLEDIDGLWRAVKGYTQEDFEKHINEITDRLPEGCGVMLNEWGVKNRGQGWKGTLADGAHFLQYMAHISLYNANYSGGIAGANFQNLFSNQPAGGCYIDTPAGYVPDIVGHLSRNLFGFICGGMEVNMVRPRAQASMEMQQLFKDGEIEWAIYMNAAGHQLVTFTNYSGKDFTVQTNAPGISWVATGDHPSAYVGPVYDHLVELGQEEATVLQGPHGGLVDIPKMSVGVFTVIAA